MKHILIIFLLLTQLTSYSRTVAPKYNFSYKVMEVEGDLNKDGLPDKVIVTQDTVHENAPYRLQVFFKEPSGQYKLIVTSTKIIEPQYPDGRDGYRTGDEFGEVSINKGILGIRFDLLRGNYEHKFRFQKGNFELIGYTEYLSDGQGVMRSIDFNLSTGVRIEKLERYDTDKLLSQKTKKILIRPLPKLQDLVPGEHELY
ncbi:hypothetical protein [Sediminibacterium sp.]|uniref:hypothetical protein n=1 Tax=Sediminibacterium sp. TaxID=1917865 RepID=UPI003F715734